MGMAKRMKGTSGMLYRVENRKTFALCNYYIVLAKIYNVSCRVNVSRKR